MGKRLVLGALVLWLTTAVADGAIYWWLYTEVASPPGLVGWGIVVSVVGLVAALAGFAAALTGAVVAGRRDEPMAAFVLLAVLTVALGAASAAAGAWLAVVQSFALAS